MVVQPAAAEGPAPNALGPTAPIAAAFRALRARWPQALCLWVAGTAWAFAARSIRQAAGEALRHPSFSLPFFANALAGAAVAAVLTTLTLRLVLAPGRGWWRPDRGFAVCVGLLTLASVVASGLISLSLSPVPIHNVARLAQHFVLTFAVEVVLYWIYARLLLWPIGAAMGNAAMRPGRSWALMRGHVARYVIAVILINLPLVVLASAFPIAAIRLRLLSAHDLVAVTTVTTAVLGPGVQLLQHAIAAVLYRARTAPPPEVRES
jgi:hypothetical protein